MDKPLRILGIVNLPWDPRLGAARVWFELSEQWKKAGHKIDKFCLDDAFPKSTTNRALYAWRQAMFPYHAARFVRRNADKFDIIVAAPGSQIDLLLRVVFLQPGAVELIQGDPERQLLGEKRAETSEENGPKNVKTKQDVINYLKSAFTQAHTAIKTIDQQNVAEPVGTGKPTRLALAVGMVGHTNNHYGQIIEYLRMNGMVPPESQPRK